MLFFLLQQSSMVFYEYSGLQNLYDIVRYCQVRCFISSFLKSALSLLDMWKISGANVGNQRSVLANVPTSKWSVYLAHPLEKLECFSLASCLASKLMVLKCSKMYAILWTIVSEFPCCSPKKNVVEVLFSVILGSLLKIAMVLLSSVVQYW